jgi:hypothetical protein
MNALETTPSTNGKHDPPPPEEFNGLPVRYISRGEFDRLLAQTPATLTPQKGNACGMTGKLLVVQGVRRIVFAVEELADFPTKYLLAWEVVPSGLYHGKLTTRPAKGNRPKEGLVVSHEGKQYVLSNPAYVTAG